MDSNNLEHIKKPTEADKNREISTTAKKNIFIVALVIILSNLYNYSMLYWIEQQSKNKKSMLINQLRCLFLTRFFLIFFIILSLLCQLLTYVRFLLASIAGCVVVCALFRILVGKMWSLLLYLILGCRYRWRMIFGLESLNVFTFSLLALAIITRMYDFSSTSDF